MSLFSRKDKANPTLRTQGIELQFNRQHDGWEFSYKGVAFWCFEHSMVLPTIAELDRMIAVVEGLKPEMKERLRKGLAEWANAKVDDGESYGIEIHRFAQDGSFVVSWSDGASWGDLGVDFTIKNNAIADEAWGD